MFGLVLVCEGPVFPSSGPLASVAFSARCNLWFSCSRRESSLCTFGVPVICCLRVKTSTA